MQFPGDVLTYEGRVARKREAEGSRLVDIELDFRRAGTPLGRVSATFALD